MACENIEDIKASLTDARAAYHDLMTGSKVRSIRDSNGETVEFQSANVGKLYAYIQALEAQVATCAGGSPLKGRGPAGFIF